MKSLKSKIYALYKAGYITVNDDEYTIIVEIHDKFKQDVSHRIPSIKRYKRLYAATEPSHVNILVRWYNQLKITIGT